MTIVKFLPLCLMLTQALTQVVTEHITYSVSVDTSYYAIGDTVHWSMKMVNLGQDTLEFEDQGDGHFYEWMLVDSANTICDGWIYIDCTSVYILPPGDSLTDDWPYALTDFWSDYCPAGRYYGLMKPWFNHDALEYDTVSFHVLEPLSISEPLMSIPDHYELHQSYPNPFNPAAIIRFDLPQSAQVRLVVYDLLGREVARLVDGWRPAGTYQTTWDGRSAGGREVPSGIYIARLVAPGYSKAMKMVLVR